MFILVNIYFATIFSKSTYIENNKHVEIAEWPRITVNHFNIIMLPSVRSNSVENDSK